MSPDSAARRHISRIWFRISAACIVLALSGCAGIGSASSQVSFDELIQKYGQPQAHWISTPFRPDSLLVLNAQDPALHSGGLLPSSFTDPTLPSEEWLNIPGLRSIRIPINPSLDQSLTYMFGPKVGDPSGVYRFEYRPKSDSACAPFLSAYHARHRLEANTIGAIPAEPPNDRCIAYTYVGPLDLSREKYVYAVYGDADFYRRGFNVTVQELRTSDGVVLARAISCFNNDRARQIAGCGADTSLRRLLLASDLGGENYK